MHCEWCVRGNFVAIIFYLLLANYSFLSHVYIPRWLWIFGWGNPLWWVFGWGNPLWLPFFNIILVDGWGIVFIWVDGFGDRFYFGSTTRVAPTWFVLFWLTVGGCHYGIRFNQCGNVNHSFSTICTVSFNIIIPFSICPNIHTLLWHGYEIQSRLCIIISFQTNTAAVMFGRVIGHVLVFITRRVLQTIVCSIVYVVCLPTMNRRAKQLLCGFRFGVVSVRRTWLL